MGVQMSEMSRRARRLVWVVVPAVLIAGGGGWFFLLRDDGGPSTRVTADGGYEVRGPDAAFPEGPPALEFRESDDAFVADLGVGESGRVLSVSAPGQPDRPVEVVIPYDPDAVPEGATPAVFYYAADAQLWLPIETEVDAEAGVLVGTTDHFTDFVGALVDGWLDKTETVVNGVATGVDWLAYQVASVTGARANEATCGEKPVWVTDVVTTFDSGFPLSAPLFACAETIRDRSDAVRVRIAVNRAYGFEITTTPPATRLEVEPSAELGSALGQAFSRIFPAQDGRVIAPGTSTVVAEFDRPSQRTLTVEGHMTPQTILVDAVMLALDVGSPFASGDLTEKVEAFECAVSAIRGVVDIHQADVFLGAWSSIVDDCLGPVSRELGTDVLGKVGIGISVGLSMGQFAQSAMDRERDLFNGATVRLTVEPAAATEGSGGFAGRWEGPVPQPGSPEYSTVVDLVDSGGRLSATVSYPGLGCSGSWSQVARSGAQAELDETITDDPGATCVPLVDIQLTLLADGRLLVRYQDSFDAVLSRSGPAAAGGNLETAPFVADWEGPVDQPGSQPYSLSLQLGITDGKFTGAAYYPELGCSGPWDEVSRDATSVTIREVIDSDPQNTCVKEGTATLRVDSAGRLLVDGSYWTAVLEAQP